MEIIHQSTKTLKTKPNDRSSDAVSPNFIYGCLGGCMKSYCYVGRYNSDKVYINDNTDKIFNSITNWVDDQVWEKIPNQCDEKYYVIDIGCSTDVSLMSKHYDWQKVFDYFNNNKKVKSTFATKYPSMLVNKQYDIDKEKNRVRVSLMPQIFSDILEPNTDSVDTRIESISKLLDKFEVHINFSPIIHHDNWLKEYENLFKKLSDLKLDLKSECIFLTHNVNQHNKNSEEIRNILWKPEIQESKNSQYAPDNIRYKSYLKHKMILDFKELYSRYFNIDNIRYIF